MRKLLILLLASCIPGLSQFPPEQPESGPAGKLYFHETVRTAGPFQPPGHEGDPWFNYYVYLPDTPRPSAAPVVLLIPGYGAWLPDQYRTWIQHMVKMGYTVVWARADQSLFAVWLFVADAEAAWSDALSRLAADPNLIPPAVDAQQRPLTGLAGHSIGGWIAAAMAARAGKGNTDYPAPKAVISLLPGRGFMLNENFSTILPDTKFVITVGDQDTIACTGTARELWEKTPQIPNANRDLLLVQSDRRWFFDLRADHAHPTGFWGMGGVDSIDFHAVWKISVGTLNCGIYGEDCGFALGNGSPEQVHTGNWSDGQPAKPLLWVPSSATLPGVPGCPW